MMFATLSKRVLGAAVAAALTLATVAPASARYYHHRHYGRHNGAVAGALALGVLGAGLAIAESRRHRYYYDDDPYYYGPRRHWRYHYGYW